MMRSASGRRRVSAVVRGASVASRTTATLEAGNQVAPSCSRPAIVATDAAMTIA